MTPTPSMALTFVVVPLEAALVSLFWALGDSLGGTCSGYAIIAPVTQLRWVRAWASRLVGRWFGPVWALSVCACLNV